LESCGFKVDYILSHSGPREVVAAIGYGEMSDDEVEDMFFCLYDEVVTI
jgi:hypothetical protein